MKYIKNKIIQINNKLISSIVNNFVPDKTVKTTGYYLQPLKKIKID